MLNCPDAELFQMKPQIDKEDTETESQQTEKTGINLYHTLLHEVTTQDLSTAWMTVIQENSRKWLSLRTQVSSFTPVITRHSRHSFWKAEYNSCL